MFFWRLAYSWSPRSEHRSQLKDWTIWHSQSQIKMNHSQLIWLTFSHLPSWDQKKALCEKITLHSNNSVLFWHPFQHEILTRNLFYIFLKSYIFHYFPVLQFWCSTFQQVMMLDIKAPMSWLLRRKSQLFFDGSLTRLDLGVIFAYGWLVRFQLLRFLVNLRFGALVLSDWHVCQPRHLAILSHETVITIHIPYWRHYYQFVLDQNNARITDLEYSSNHSHRGCR